LTVHHALHSNNLQVVSPVTVSSAAGILKSLDLASYAFFIFCFQLQVAIIIMV